MDTEFESRLINRWRVTGVIALYVLATSLSAGCAYSHPPRAAYGQRIQQAAKVFPPGQWLPVHVVGNAIVAIGTYSLPQPISVPPGLTPRPVGLVNIDPPYPSIAVQVFFEPKDEKTVFDWARRGNLVTTASEPGYWFSKHKMYMIQATGTTRKGTAVTGYAWSHHDPSEMPPAWRIYGVFDTNRSVNAVTWSAKPIVTAAGENPFPTSHLPYPGDAVQLVGDNAGDFGPNSPVMGQKRIVSLQVSFLWRKPEQWLPIRFSNHRITAVGNHVLRSPIAIPVELKPLAQAQVAFRDDAMQDLRGISIYFPTAEEKAVMKWAQSYPGIVDAGPDATWTRKNTLFETGQETSAGGYLVLCAPTSPDLLAWHISGLLKADTIVYGMSWHGVSVVTSADLKNNPLAQLLLNGAAADYTGPGSDFGPNSPLQREERHIKLTIVF